MNSKYWLALLLSLSLFVISCTSCKQGSAGIDSPQKISIATSKNPWSALTIIAHKKGFFKEQGLEVDLQYVQAAKLAMDALISGSTQLSNVVETNVAFLGFTGSKDISIIATHCEAHDGAIVGRKDAKILTPKDLEGKKLGVLQGTTSQIFADRFIEKYGLKNVQIVNLTTVAIQSSVVSKDIDAGSIWQPFIYNVQKQLGDNAVVFADTDVYVGYFSLAVQRNWAKSNPKLVEKALQAHIKAEEFAKSNPDEAIALVAEEVGIDKAALGQFWNQYVYRVQVKPDLAREIAKEGDWIKNTQPQHKGQAVPTYDWAIDDSYLRTVASDRVAQ
jgi:ABC-type nitrate/sulfonate/bicarbonate transport system substrate-binding protein